MENAIYVKDLVREYDVAKSREKGGKSVLQALKGISFEVNKGEIFGLLGPNGAGKTTTIKILTTMLTSTSGEARVLGYDVNRHEKELRNHINFIFGGERGLYWRLSARDNLMYFSDLYRLDRKTRTKRVPELLEMVGLADRADEKVERYSKGMKQRLQIARGLINDPKVVFLDEPTLGLDPIGARELKGIIKELKSLDKTILLTTHYMLEADELCDRIAIIDKGEIKALDTPDKLKKLNANMSVIEVTTIGISGQAIEELKLVNGVQLVNVQDMDQQQQLQIHCESPSMVVQGVLGVLSQFKVIDMCIREATLEDAYVKLVEGKE